MVLIIRRRDVETQIAELNKVTKLLDIAEEHFPDLEVGFDVGNYGHNMEGRYVEGWAHHADIRPSWDASIILGDSEGDEKAVVYVGKEIRGTVFYKSGISKIASEMSDLRDRVDKLADDYCKVTGVNKNKIKFA